ncbi:MAG: ABC transporter ATP-binding protein [Kiritimatiellae bacterium]|nr:ABC transporter ATP-binding protein [Kiritimatiellia bacterium]
MDALVAKGVCRGYGRQKVLESFSLTVGSGRFEALMGPSGSGKSTFLHVAAGLLAADAGSVSIGGTEVTALSDAAAAKFRRRHVGVVFQSFNLLSEKTAKENILLPLKLDGAAKGPGVEERLERLADALGIADALDKRPDELSGGEQQRVAIARALVVEPDVVLADEPTGNLDRTNSQTICELLRGLNASVKSAILLVTHDPVVAACAQCVHFLKGGHIAASHDPQGDPACVSELYLETCR